MGSNSKEKPWIQGVVPQVIPPSLEDNTADVDRLLKAIKKSMGTSSVTAGFSLLKQIPRRLRECDFSVRAILYKSHDTWQLIDIQPAQSTGIYGLALDLGTSTVVIRLMDLSTSKIMEETNFHNPQIEIGPDVLSRIHFAATKGGLEKLQSLLIEALNREINRLTETHAIAPESIAGISAAGNTAMTHLFLGLDPYWIIREPYIPVVNGLQLLRASDLGICVHPQAPVLVFPNVGSYFGGDLIAGILSSGIAEGEDISLLVDVGTNAEVVIGNRDWLMACAGAAGPALEGGVAGMGMMAGPGVIDRVAIDPETGRFDINVIGHQPPVGICGSGLIDLVAQLFLAGAIDMRGKFVPARCGPRLAVRDGVPHLIIVSSTHSGTGEHLTLSQPDIDALIRSKAAMYTILTTISNTVNVPFREIHRFYVAGTFGAYINPGSAVTLGMIPDLPLDTYVPLGNTSIEGASRALVSARSRDRISEIRDMITYLELNVNQEFMNLFSAAKFIPHTDRSLFPSVKPYTPSPNLSLK